MIQEISSLYNLNQQQRILAVLRLIALWAFSESVLGGLIHTKQVPFTGMIITRLMMKFYENHYKQVLKNLLTILLIKLAIGHRTPFSAYVTVSFKTLVGYILAWQQTQSIKGYIVFKFLFQLC